LLRIRSVFDERDGIGGDTGFFSEFSYAPATAARAEAQMALTNPEKS
jgi:hypothetical protein